MDKEWDTGVWRPPSDNNSYFDKVNASREQQIRDETTRYVKAEAEKVIHNLVSGKDAEIARLREKIDNQQKEIESLKREKRHFVIPDEPEFIPDEVNEYVEVSPVEFVSGLQQIIKYGKSEKGFSQDELEKIRLVVLSWKKFFEEYKWKSNYISVKIKKLLKDTESIL